jgi:hypothetical protein
MAKIWIISKFLCNEDGKIIKAFKTKTSAEKQLREFFCDWVERNIDDYDLDCMPKFENLFSNSTGSMQLDLHEEFYYVAEEHELV